MMGEERRRGQVIGFLVSLGIHLSLAAIVFWPGGLVLRVSPADARDPIAVVAEALPKMPTFARPGVHAIDSTRKILTPRPRGESSPLSRSGFRFDFGEIGERAARLFPFVMRSVSLERFGLTPRQDERLRVPPEFVRGARPASNASQPTLERDAAMSQALVDQSWSQRDGRNVFQPIEKLARDNSHLGKWINHLWQSTVFAVVAGLLTIAFRRNRAHVRYWLWFSASVKFFVPFTLLIALGSHLPGAPAAQKMAERALAVRISQPFPDSWRSGLWSPSTPDTLTSSWPGLAVFGVWACGFGAIALIRFRMWGRIRAAVRASTPFEIRGSAIPASIQVRSAPGLLEPGVVGWWRPVLLLPSGIEGHLTRPQLEAVLTHELCHIRRCDNLTAAIHMAVEAVFWFHPVVWWIGARLVEERERACDEDVLRAFGEPQAYAEGILNVCKRYVESPLECVSGVSGSGIRKRIEAILRNECGEAVNLWRKLVLGAAIVLAVAVPFGVGVLSGPRLHAQQVPASVASGPTFQVASIKPNPTGSTGPTSTQVLPGGRYVATNMPIRLLIGQTYRVSSLRLVGGPSWIASEHFDINAKADGELFPRGGERPLESALRALLADRFKLVVHTETRQLPIYALMLARRDGRLGPNLTSSSKTDCDAVLAAAQGRGGGPPPPSAPGEAPPCGARTFPSTIWADSLTISQLAGFISGEVNRTVEDRTGLTGRFNFHLTWTPDRMPQQPPGAPDDLPPVDPNGPSIFTALQEQLGLKLESTTGPVEVLVIDSVERPTPN
jgi:bla regulator protein BlaR1